MPVYLTESFHGGSDDEKSDCNAGRPRFDSWVRKMPWRREWQPALGSLPRESHGFSWNPMEPGRLQSLGLQRIGHDWVTNIYTHTSLPELQIFNILPLVLILSFLPSLSVQILFGHPFPDNEAGHLLSATRMYFYACLWEDNWTLQKADTCMFHAPLLIY